MTNGKVHNVPDCLSVVERVFVAVSYVHTCSVVVSIGDWLPRQNLASSPFCFSLACEGLFLRRRSPCSHILSVPLVQHEHHAGVQF